MESFHNGVVHKLIPLQDAQMISKAKEAMDKVWNRMKLLIRKWMEKRAGFLEQSTSVITGGVVPMDLSGESVTRRSLAKQHGQG